MSFRFPSLTQLSRTRVARQRRKFGVFGVAAAAPCVPVGASQAPGGVQTASGTPNANCKGSGEHCKAVAQEVQS